MVNAQELLTDLIVDRENVMSRSPLKELMYQKEGDEGNEWGLDLCTEDDAGVREEPAKIFIKRDDAFHKGCLSCIQNSSLKNNQKTDLAYINNIRGIVIQMD